MGIVRLCRGVAIVNQLKKHPKKTILSKKKKKYIIVVLSPFVRVVHDWN